MLAGLVIYAFAKAWAAHVAGGVSAFTSRCSGKKETISEVEAGPRPPPLYKQKPFQGFGFLCNSSSLFSKPESTLASAVKQALGHDYTSTAHLAMCAIYS